MWRLSLWGRGGSVCATGEGASILLGPRADRDLPTPGKMFAERN